MQPSSSLLESIFVVVVVVVPEGTTPPQTWSSILSATAPQRTKQQSSSFLLPMPLTRSYVLSSSSSLSTLAITNASRHDIPTGIVILPLPPLLLGRYRCCSVATEPYVASSDNNNTAAPYPPYPHPPTWIHTDAIDEVMRSRLASRVTFVTHIIYCY